jgi:fumarate reductase subunit C
MGNVRSMTRHGWRKSDMTRINHLRNSRFQWVLLFEVTLTLRLLC